MMANIKTKPEVWSKAKEYYEAGLSYTVITEKTGISKTQLSKIVNRDGWSKGTLPANRSKASMDTPTHIYVITADEFGDLYKIGLTNSIDRRIASMQTGCPYMLHAFRSYEVSNPVAVEVMLHAFFHKKRVRGEWFRLDSVDLKYVDEAMENIEGVLSGR